jgi:programmed cell death protein 5
MASEEEIKRALLQKKMQEAQLEEAQKTLKDIVSNILDKPARQRLANLRLVKPEVATQLELYLAQLYQMGQIKHITEDQLIQILKKITEKPDFKIKRK